MPLNKSKAIKGFVKNEKTGLMAGLKMTFSQSHAGIPAINSGGTTKYRTAICTIWALNIMCPSRSTGLPSAAYKNSIADRKHTISLPVIRFGFEDIRL